VRWARLVVGSKLWLLDRQVSITRVIEGTVIDASAIVVARITLVFDDGRKTLCCSLVERDEWRGSTRRFLLVVSR